MIATLPRIANNKTRESVSQRFISVDALRGFDMFWIMGGDFLFRSFYKIYDTPWTRELNEQMEHVPYEGFHFYDLIFPLFIFIVGVSITFSLPRVIEQHGKFIAVKRIFIRSVILFLLGIFYMGGIAGGFENIYLAGVLQRISVAYFFAAIIFCFTNLKQMIALCILMLVGYWAVLTFVPVPGFDVPSYEQGKNLAHYIDRWLPGQKFEGTILSTLGAVANCLIGVFAGLLLKNKENSDQKRVGWLLAGGLICIIVGSIWGMQFPIIKALWTSSYVLVACGCGAILLGIFYQVIEIWKFQKWAQPFVWIGMNAITIYIAASILNFRKLSQRFVGGDVKTLLGNYSDLITSLVALLLMFWFVHFLYKRKVFIKI
jgi:Uncharacterized conserved protein